MTTSDFQWFISSSVEPTSRLPTLAESHPAVSPSKTSDAWSTGLPNYPARTVMPISAIEGSRWDRRNRRYRASTESSTIREQRAKASGRSSCRRRDRGKWFAHTFTNVTVRRTRSQARCLRVKGLKIWHRFFNAQGRLARTLRLGSQVRRRGTRQSMRRNLLLLLLRSIRKSFRKRSGHSPSGDLYA